MAHKAGSFCWTELMTTDVEKVRSFYSAALDWKYKDVPMPGGGGTYTMAQIGGKDAAGLSKMDPQMAKHAPPHWGVYVAVDDVDATVKKATELGGKQVMAPFDIPDVGRMAVIQDPAGAVISLWWNKGHSGTGADREAVGAFCWGELMTNNLDKAQSFYTKLFGWKAKASTDSKTTYVEWVLGDEHIGGMMEIPKEAKGMPPVWSPYFAVTNVRKTVDVVKKNGGKVLNGPMDMENVGSFATVTDPTGAAFNLYQSARKK